MLWFLGLAAVSVGAVAWAYNSVTEEEREARRRWERKREEVEKTLEEHQANIQEHIKQAQSSYDFHLLTNLHYSSVKVADSAYKLLGDARDSIRGINTMLMNAKKHKLELEAQLQIAKQNKNKEEFSKIISELKQVNEMRRSLFEDKELVSSQKEKFYIEVKRLNQQTSELKNFIRYRCGNRGIEWYQRLEMRKAANNMRKR